MKKQVNMSQNQEDGNWAIYLPAISTVMPRILSNLDNDVHCMGTNRLPAEFEHGHEGMNFLKPRDTYYNYKWALYSAGHAHLDLVKAKKTEAMIHGRDREKTIIVGDSGGFQIATGVIKLDWTTVMTSEGDPLREKILRWLEETADWSMTLDVPAYAASEKYSKKTGLTSFQDTLDVTLYNLHYFVRERIPGKTKFLNVMSGSNAENARLWYNDVKHFSIPSSMKEMGYDENRTLEGIAFAGTHSLNLYCTLDRILDLIEDKIIHTADWLHILGVGKLDFACYYTSLMRQVQKHYNPNFKISFDAASPFITVAKGGCYTYSSYTPTRLTCNIQRAIDDIQFKNSKLRMPFQSPILDRLTLKDICIYGANDLNRFGKVNKTSWDTFSYLLYMVHNVYKHIDSVQEVNRIADIEIPTHPVNYTSWLKDKKFSSVDKISDYLPIKVLYFNDFVTKLLDPANPDPRLMLEENRRFLEEISTAESTHDTFDHLFGSVDSATINKDKEQSDYDLALEEQIADDKLLSKLEKTLE